MPDELYYDYERYWIKEGELSPQDSLSYQINGDHKAQEKPLLELCQEINPRTVLEIGAGWGRITNLLRGHGVGGVYTVMDISRSRLMQIPKYLEVDYVCEDFHKATLPSEGYDLIVAVELLMHIPPDIVEIFVEKMKMYAKRIITIDYDPTIPRDIELADHNFLHNYDELLPNNTPVQVNYMQKMRLWEK